MRREYGRVSQKKEIKLETKSLCPSMDGSAAYEQGDLFLMHRTRVISRAFRMSTSSLSAFCSLLLAESLRNPDMS
jgi:hypothetical protein